MLSAAHCLLLAAVLVVSTTARAEQLTIVIAPVFPPTESTVPRNVRPVIGGTVTDALFQRVATDGTRAPIAATPIFGKGTAFDLSLDDLPSGSVIEVNCGLCLAAAFWELADIVDETPPVFADGEPAISATSFSNGPLDLATRGYDVQVSVPPATDDTGLVLMRARSDDGVDVFGTFPSQGATSNFVSFRLVDPAPRELCLRITAMDVAGTEVDLPDPVCTDLGVAARGCNASPQASVLGCLLLLGLKRRGLRRA